MIAICFRVLQFVAGPNEHTFYACPEHKHYLEGEADVDLFFSTSGDLLEEVNPEDEFRCDFCEP